MKLMDNRKNDQLRTRAGRQRPINLAAAPKDRRSFPMLTNTGPRVDNVLLSLRQAARRRAWPRRIGESIARVRGVRFPRLARAGERDQPRGDDTHRHRWV